MEALSFIIYGRYDRQALSDKHNINYTRLQIPHNGVYYDLYVRVEAVEKYLEEALDLTDPKDGELVIEVLDASEYVDIPKEDTGQWYWIVIDKESGTQMILDQRIDKIPVPDPTSHTLKGPYMSDEVIERSRGF
ncbi:MAG: hypothetical protein Unbinned3891contig1000_43 [Prokaryotic dsDNA virus sp.]|nr:MAG: hypothetical protein Unbinned3891contig1000_43 [Prokaryotic dsDNA virus sp.]|tara:strand:- start:69436 stop:69837 length:402 start_codon:yes stop_codon:yes gene_type:complete